MTKPSAREMERVNRKILRWEAESKVLVPLAECELEARDQTLIGEATKPLDDRCQPELS